MLIGQGLYSGMQDVWLMLAAMLLCMGAVAYAAYLLAKKLPLSVSVVLAGLSAAGMLLFGRFLTDSLWIASFMPPRWLPVFGNWLPLMAGALAGFGWVISPRARGSKVMVLGILAILSLYLPYRSIFEARPPVSNRWEQGVCLQSTNATCGAGAAATLLSTVGVISSEEEMVDLCFSTWRGTSVHGMLRGLAIKLEGTQWRVRVREMSPAELVELNKPAILQVGLESIPPDIRYVTEWGWIPGVVHTAVMFQVLPEGYLDIGDPTTGRERWSPEALEVLWQGVAITLEKRD